MEISGDTENVLAFLDSYSNGNLRKRDDLGTILELAARSGAHEAMNDALFTGRQLFSLYTTLRHESPGSEGFRKLEEEFRRTVEALRAAVARLLDDADAEEVERFERLYYAATQGSLRNLLDLAHDLGLLKSVQNERKYGAGPGESGDL